MPETMKKRAGVISLGCDKNRVDSERLIRYLTDAGFEITNEEDKAQVLIVNTCAFIASARREAVETILSTAENKKSGDCEKLIVSGCLPVKHLAELEEGLPEVDAFIGTANYGRLPEIIARLYAGERVSDTEETDPFNGAARTLSTPMHYAYLKIAEGCDNRCTYCTIPAIRGAYRSRDFASLVAEAEGLAESGVKELILVAQDTTRYGSDLGGGENLAGLVRRLHEIEGLEWIRLMYLYPESVTDELISVMAELPKVCKYADIPMQHISDGILKRMGRRTGGADIKDLITRMRKRMPELSVRSSFIVGFPGETEEEFRELLEFLTEYRLNNAGFFGYSREEGTPAYRLPGQVPRGVIRRRLSEAGRRQKEIVRDINSGLVGRTVRVLYEGIDYGKGKLYGRTEWNAPEVDGLVYFDSAFADVGSFCEVEIRRAKDYDLYGLGK